jgi:hypothetical protein
MEIPRRGVQVFLRQRRVRCAQENHGLHRASRLAILSQRAPDKIDVLLHCRGLPAHVCRIVDPFMPRAFPLADHLPGQRQLDIESKRHQLIIKARIPIRCTAQVDTISGKHARNLWHAPGILRTLLQCGMPDGSPILQRKRPRSSRKDNRIALQRQA